VKSLYTLTSAEKPGAKGGPEDPPIKLIELRFGLIRRRWAEGRGGRREHRSLPVFRSRLSAPYWFAALEKGPERAESHGSRLPAGDRWNSADGILPQYVEVRLRVVPDSQSAGPFAFS